MLIGPFKKAGMALVAGALLAAPSSAVAAKPKPTAVSVQGSTLSVVSGGGADNNVLVKQVDGLYEVSDTVATTAGSGCVAVDGSVSCAASGVTDVDVDVDQRKDSVVIGPMEARATVYTGGDDDVVQAFNAAAFVSTGGGDDVVITGDGNDTLDTGGGSDSLRAGGGDDVLLGGSGKADYLDGGPGADSISGGGGADDVVDYSFRGENLVVDLDSERGDDGALGEGDSVGVDVEDLIGGYGDDVLVGNHFDNFIDGGVSGDDTLVGARGDDRLEGWTGNDVIDGGLGKDQLVGYEGDDVLSAADGVKDDVSCGSDADVAEVDAGKDRVEGCETLL